MGASDREVIEVIDSIRRTEQLIQPKRELAKPGLSSSGGTFSQFTNDLRRQRVIPAIEPC